MELRDHANRSLDAAFQRRPGRRLALGELSRSGDLGAIWRQSAAVEVHRPRVAEAREAVHHGADTSARLAQEMYGIRRPEPDDDSTRARSARAMLELHDDARNVPAAVLFCVKEQPLTPPLLLGSSVYPALQNFLLALRDVGLGACLTGWQLPHPEDFREAIGIPEEWHLAALVAISWPKGKPGPMNRKPVADVTLPRPLGVSVPARSGGQYGLAHVGEGRQPGFGCAPGAASRRMGSRPTAGLRHVDTAAPQMYCTDWSKRVPRPAARSTTEVAMPEQIKIPEAFPQVGDVRAKRVVLTGASRGLGELIAHAFSRGGAELALVARTERDLKELADRLPGRTIVFAGDVRDEHFNEAVADGAVAELGGVDVWICNAGISPVLAGPLKTTADVWRDVVDVNLTGAFLGARAAARVMTHGGRVIFTGSVLGERPAKGLSAYSASKAGLVGMAKSLALDLAGSGITVNVVAPGWFDSPLADSWTRNPRLSEAVLGHTALNRWGQSTDLTGAYQFLASDAAAFITGTVVNVDGGYLLS